MKQTTILIVGGAATGRSPMTAALLERLLAQRGLHWRVVAAGVVAHEDDPAEIEARDAMITLGLNIADYRALALSDELMREASAIVAVDSGTARVIFARYPEVAARTLTLGELAGRQRDIPDPFRMQIGAWITYAREIELLLKLGIERLIERADAVQPNTLQGAPASVSPRDVALDHCQELLAGLPAGVDWQATRSQIDDALSAVGAQPLHSGDLANAYIALLRALLNMTAASPTSGQAAFLGQAIDRLRTSIDQQAITELSAQMGAWASR